MPRNEATGLWSFCLSRRVNPSAGRGRRLEAPPEINTMRRSFASSDSAMPRSLRAARRPRLSGMGWPATATWILDAGAGLLLAGATTRPPSTRLPSTSQAPAPWEPPPSLRLQRQSASADGDRRPARPACSLEPRIETLEMSAAAGSTASRADRRMRRRSDRTGDAGRISGMIFLT